MSLYLKYRPQDFDSLVGQDFIKSTLKKSIEQDKAVGAYLFCGPRGTGKTSTARIMAKALNCENTKEGNPCLECSICKDFVDNKLVDILEIDAASNTGVDNIREIIEKAQFTPNKTKYKVYIIDEVHMLSKGAFNALLKILEEPPSHVKFILATTETHKVPETIVSRCQRYDFRNGTPQNINDRITFIAKSESVKIDEKSLEYIIRSSGGGYRNAISLFEQLITDNEVIFDDVIKRMGITNDGKLKIFLDKLKSNDLSIIDDFTELEKRGKNIKLFFKDLIFYIKDEIISEIRLGNNVSKLINILEQLNNTYSATKNSIDENTTFLIGLLKVNNYSPLSQPFPPGEKGVNIKSIGKEKIETKKEEQIEKKEIDNDDVNDVFGLEDEKKESSRDTLQCVSTENTVSSNFDKEKYITQLKKDGAKGGLTMGIRGADLNLEGNELIINFKTKFALKNTNTPDNIAILNKALLDLGFDGVSVELKG